MISYRDFIRFVAFNNAYLKNFVSDFFETLKIWIWMVENKELHVARSTFIHTRSGTIYRCVSSYTYFATNMWISIYIFLNSITFIYCCCLHFLGLSHPRLSVKLYTIYIDGDHTWGFHCHKMWQGSHGPTSECKPIMNVSRPPHLSLLLPLLLVADSPPRHRPNCLLSPPAPVDDACLVTPCRRRSTNAPNSL
jgi:hypothetical protein